MKSNWLKKKETVYVRRERILKWNSPVSWSLYKIDKTQLLIRENHSQLNGTMRYTNIWHNGKWWRFFAWIKWRTFCFSSFCRNKKPKTRLDQNGNWRYGNRTLIERCLYICLHCVHLHKPLWLCRSLDVNKSAAQFAFLFCKNLHAELFIFVMVCVLMVLNTANGLKYCTGYEQSIFFVGISQIEDFPKRKISVLFNNRSIQCNGCRFGR